MLYKAELFQELEVNWGDARFQTRINFLSSDCLKIGWTALRNNGFPSLAMLYVVWGAVKSVHVLDGLRWTLHSLLPEDSITVGAAPSIES